MAGSKKSGKTDLTPYADEKIDRAVKWLAERKTAMEQELTLHAKIIGDYLLREFFNNDILMVASQNPNKNISFRKLCQRQGIPFSETSLRRFIQVAINFRLLPETQAAKLLPSHHSVLYQVADPEQRRDIGIKAADQGVSVRKLREMVKGKGKRRPGGGRKSDSEFKKGWRQLMSLLETLVDEADREQLENLCGPDDLEGDCVKINDMVNKLMGKVGRNIDNIDKNGK